MKKIILFILLISFSAFGQWSHENYFTYPTETSDGMIKIASETKLTEGVKWVRIRVSGNGKFHDYMFPADESGTFDKNVALRFGPGEYEVMIMTSKSESKYSNYAYEHKVTVTNSLENELDHIAPTCDLQSDDEEIVKLAQEITQGIEDDLEKTKAIHNWVTNNIAYDVESYFSETYGQKSWDALTVLKSRKAICFGYSNLTAALNRAAGLKSRVIMGIANPMNTKWASHAWNEVLIGDRWVIQDTTWDAGYVDSTMNFTFAPKTRYFDPDPETFSLDHLPNNK